MKAIKIYLVVVTILLVIALAAGVYVWFIIQDAQVQLGGVIEDDQPLTDEVQQENIAEHTEEGEIKEPVVIDVKTLPESQQNTLKTFGFEGETVTITPAMIICAEDTVGKARFDAIISGAPPSPLESLKLLPCLKK